MENPELRRLAQALPATSHGGGFRASSISDEGQAVGCMYGGICRVHAMYELIRLKGEDITFNAEGMVIKIVSSKTNQ